ncbi:CLUMA_CG000209, isoform A [Clunio marinus]|uniref:CLUMA_CG000209, isoform A n=1 Tax=Clunio marinus TaxID=568069 RepID=A0A1J1HJY7_9DIPT|nr:CLUMA_CG000209, isoform A [Clunio marinus]
MKVQFLLPFMLISVINAQRGSYAGVRPIENGIKGPFPSPPPTNINNRFGDDSIGNGLPVDALGDYNLVNKLSQLPLNKQPFWLLNYQHIEAHRNQPQFTGQAITNRGSFTGR